MADITSRITFRLGYCFNQNQFKKYFPEFLVPSHMGLEIIDPDFPYTETNLNKLLGNNSFKWILKVDDYNQKYYLSVVVDERSRIDFLKFISENPRLNKINENLIEFLL